MSAIKVSSVVFPERVFKSSIHWQYNIDQKIKREFEVIKELEQEL